MRPTPVLSGFLLAAVVGSTLAIGTPSALAAAPATESAYLREGNFRSASETSKATVARLLARLGILSIRGAGANPSPNDFALTAMILGLANEIDPGNLDILRRRIDSWHGAGEQGLASDLTARLVQLDPADSVAQLRLISSRINNMQTAEARIAAYDRILSPAGASLDPAIRSRLALDAALLARERGDGEGFVDRLTRATQLDSTNKDAAALAASIVLRDSKDAQERAEALLNVVLADPMDASSHANLARELRNAGVFRVAQRFQDNADAIHAAEGRYFDVQISYERLLTLWGVSGPEAVASALDDRERAMRKSRADEIAAYQAAGRQPPPGAAPEQVTLEPALEVLRAAANLSLNRMSRVETTTRLLARQAGQVQEYIAQAEQQGVDPRQIEQIGEQFKGILSELLWLRLWAGVNLDDADGMLTSMRDTGLLTDSRAVQRYEGFLALHRGDYATAEAKFEPLLDEDPRARIGMALLEEARGNTRAAASQLAPLAVEQTGTMLGMYARSTIERLLDQPIAASAVARRLTEYFKSVPLWLDGMTRDPREFMVMDVSWESTTPSVFDGLPVRIRLRNLGRIPLPVGPSLTINSRLLLSPDVTLGGAKPENRLAPEVAEFSRALRVMPGASTEILVQSDIGAVGVALDNTATQVATLRWQVAQGFLVDQRGAFYKGPTSISATSPLLTRRRVGIPDESPEGVARALDGAQGDRVMEVLFVFRDLAIRTLSMEDREAANRLTNAIVSSVAASMPRMSELDRAAAVLLVASVYPRTVRTGIDEEALTDTSELVRMVALITRENDPQHPAFHRAFDEGSESIQALVRSLQERLRAAAEFQAQQQQRQQGQQAPGQGQGGLRFDPTK